jgi:hypothetical protein
MIVFYISVLQVTQCVPMKVEVLADFLMSCSIATARHNRRAKKDLVVEHFF